MSTRFETAAQAMERAIELARRGEGRVEPNPMVGAVIVSDQGELLGEGWHQRFGAAHAEVAALEQAGERARGGTLYVTLEPCCHFGKTPPCVEAILRAGIRRVVVALQDPFPQVAGQGLARLREAGLDVDVGMLEQEGRRLAAPFLMLTEQGRPWVHAKWAMTLDGKLASHTGHSQWISNPASRQVGHALRGRMDAIIVGIGTALADDPLLTARPPGARRAARIVVDSVARLPSASRLVKTSRESPLLVAVSAGADAARVERLRNHGVEVVPFPEDSDHNTGGSRVSLTGLLSELGRRRMTNVLVEGGGRLLGSLFDRQLVDEVHVFLAPKLVGGEQAPSPVGGIGLPEIPLHASLVNPRITLLDGDVSVQGFVRRN
ncbi:MAG: bifunctional diaminohydroxyphosphoribosylaminopyrimidine deaminase/5-amino-6-(5-phosphoribosylamino)uracil reductase RibD [Planctomycetales bacterium]